MRYFALLSLVGVLVSFGSAQTSSNSIFLNNQVVSPTQLNIRSARNSTEWPTNNCSSQGCYAIIQLEDLSFKDELFASNQFDIHGYIPNNAFIVSRNISEPLELPHYISAVLAIDAIHKQPLFNPDSPTTVAASPDSYELLAFPFPNINTTELAEALITLGAQVSNITDHEVYYSIASASLYELLNCPLLLYTEPQTMTPFPEGNIGRSSLRISGINQGPGQGYDGNGINMCIADDGSIDHLDFHGRLFDHTQYNTGFHGEMTTGMAAGCGNIDPSATGAAPGVNVHLFDIVNYDHIQNAVELFNEHGIVISSTSYGEGCGDAYTSSAQFIDNQVYNNQQLLHCFSAGNHGNSACSNNYGWLGANADGRYYCTITGGRKTGKNVITVANNDWNDQIISSSSLGPTPDGRLKPELSALGNADYTTGSQNTYINSSGTSAAAPNVAGGLAGLYQYYKAHHNNEYPSSALIKAIAMNTADDQGAPGPDFNYGWGRLNTRKALRVLEQQHYFNNQIDHGQQQSFQFVVPQGAKRLKIMLYWHDPAANQLASRDLVNDLDLSLRLPNNEVLLPWIANAHTHLDSLAQPARAGKDRLNNAEQIVVDNPSPGFYNALIDGFQIPMDTQSYYIVYEIETEKLSISNPVANSAFVPQEQTLITWDAVSNEGTFNIDYRIGPNNNWTTLAQNIPGNHRSFLWMVPNINTTSLRFRIRRGTDEVAISGDIVIAPLVDFDVSYLSPTQAQLSWLPITGASAYAVYRLGNKYMEVIGTTSDLFYNINATINQKYWLAVAPIFDTKQGRRTNARTYQHYGCDQQVNLHIQFDQYPAETSWSILQADGSVFDSGGPYTDQAPHSSINKTICMPAGCFTLFIRDAYSDGLCCNNGNGSFTLSNSSGQILVQGSEFNAYTYGVFCVEQSNELPLTLQTEIVQNISCANGQNGIISANVSGGSGNYSYLWSTGAQSSSIQNLGPGNYHVSISDGTQSLTQSILLTAPPAIQITHNSIAASCNDGQISLNVSGGAPPYSYLWTDGNTQSNRQHLAAGTYTVMVSDANGCSQSANINVAAAAPLSITLTTNAPSCSTHSDGSIQAHIQGAHGNYQLFWSNGIQNSTQIEGLAAGSYSLSVQSGLCQSIETIQLTANPSMQIEANVAQPSCANSNDAFIDVDVLAGSAPYNYSWSSGQQTSEINNLGTGLYLLTVTDANGCASTRGYEIDAPSPLQLSANITPIQTGSLASIAVDITGGSPPYLVNWAHGAQSANINNLSSGIYSITVNDSQGCSASSSFFIEEENIEIPDLIYCSMSGASTAYEWINSIILNGNSYHSGNDGGYGDYTDIHIPLQLNATQNIELNPAYNATNYNENWVIWIDYNRDGDFEDSQERVATLGPAAGAISTNFQIPANALLGSTRMRIAMQYGSAPSLCQNINYGEVEDYTIDIIDGIQAIQLQNKPIADALSLELAKLTKPQLETSNTDWYAYPNPAANSSVLQTTLATDEALQIAIYNLNGQLVEQYELMGSKGLFTHKLALKDYNSGVYLIKIQGDSWQKQLKLIKK